MADVGIIQSLTKIPLGLLSAKLDAAGPYPHGNHSLTTWTDGLIPRNVSDTFGVIVTGNGPIAPKLGLTFGYDDGANIDLDRYDDRVCQVAALHQLLSGAWVVDQVEDVHILGTMLRWAEDLPGKIGLYVGPTWNVDLYYLVTI